MAIAKSNRFAARIARSSDRRRAPRNRQRSRGRKEAARVLLSTPSSRVSSRSGCAFE